MEHRLLRSFVAVAEELHFGRAAARLHISQPPLSEQIRKLEAELGARLLERTSRRVRLTTAGSALLDRARPLLDDVERAREEVARIARGASGTVVIGYTPTATHLVLPPLLRLLRRAHPGLQLVLREMASPTQPRALLERRIDLGLACLPVPSPGLRAEPICQERLVAVLPAGHRLAGRRRVPLAELVREGMIAMDPAVEPGWARAGEAALADAGLVVSVVQRVDTKIALLGLVAAGVGVALASTSLATLRRRGLVFRPLAERVRLDLGLLTREEPSEPALAQVLARVRGLARRGAYT